jgi:hypothetical protein
MIVHYGIIADIDSEESGELPKPIENPTLPVAVIPPGMRISTAKVSSSNAASDAVVNADTVFSDDLGACAGRQAWPTPVVGGCTEVSGSIQNNSSGQNIKMVWDVKDPEEKLRDAFPKT